MIAVLERLLSGGQARIDARRLAEREHDLALAAWRASLETSPREVAGELEDVVARIVRAAEAITSVPPEGSDVGTE